MSEGTAPQALPDPEDEPVPENWNTDYHVHRWQAGDNSAFDALERHFRRLLISRVRHNPAWPYLGRHCEAEDVVQDVWCKVVDYARENFTTSGKGSFLALVRTLCDRTLADLTARARTQKRGEGERGESLGEQHAERAVHKPGAAVEPTPTSDARHSEIVAKARELLTPREFLAWSYVYLVFYTSEEVGELVLDGDSGAAVRGLLLRARAKLARWL